MKNCNICPRKCNFDRASSVGFCMANNELVINKVMLHQFEEPILTNKTDSGSGAIFFAGCNLKCVYCQNYDISHQINGKHISVQELVNIFKLLEKKGAGNIDFVTPTHYSTQIIEALKIYKPNIPVIWNTSGYESVETIKKLNGLVDIYLTDFKYYDNNLALKYSKTNNYFENATSALKEMFKQQPKNIFEGDKLVKGIIVRHMVLPTNAKDSIKVLETIKNILGDDAIISIMSQYTPMGDAKLYPEINRKISKMEYKLVTSYALNHNLKNCFVQELESANEFYTPNFKNEIIEI